ncbi:hypothetical protein E0K83_02180 [Gramella sp. BOM4]|nr:hypothetical protein [Christiangramia bathymodioli]
MIINKNEIDIILVADKNVEIGLHVTLYSLLENSSLEFHRIHVITKAFTNSFLNNLRNTLLPFKGKFELNIIEFDDSIFKSYKGLHGNTFVYTKLVLSNLIKVDVAVYLDIDIVVNVDISSINSYFTDDFLNKNAIAANKEGKIKDSLEYVFLKKLGKKESDKYYNTGIMLVNLDLWRKLELPKLFLNFAEKHYENLKTADQTVINGILDNSMILEIPEKFNYRIENTLSNHFYKNKMVILHFFGRPKPWDLFAEYIHPHYNIFKEVLDKTEFRKYNSIKSSNSASRKKLLKTYKSYIKLILS